MSTTVHDERWERFEPSDDPEVRARELWIVGKLLDLFPEVALPIQLREARWTLRRVLVLRGLATSAEDEARIDACTELATLHRWHGKAITAATAAEALR
jgi:hypothetical protein